MGETGETKRDRETERLRDDEVGDRDRDDEAWELGWHDKSVDAFGTGRTRCRGSLGTKRG